MTVSDTDLASAATTLAASLESLLDVLGERDWGSRKSEQPRSPRALCQSAELDFLTYQDSPISERTKDRGQFRRHLIVCECCLLRETCLELAIIGVERWGIWGGTLPRDRKGMYEPGVVRR